MADQDRWQALADALVAVQDATRAQFAPMVTRAAIGADHGARQHVMDVADVIGRGVAERYATSLSASRAATERLDALVATLTAAASVDAADNELLRQLDVDRKAAARAYEAATVEVVAAVEQAMEQEKGGA